MRGHFRDILCVLTSIDEQSKLINQALHVANSHQAKITFQFALESLPPNAGLVMASLTYIESHQSLQKEAQKRLEQTIGHFNLAEQPVCVVTIGKPFYDVIQQVQNCGHDLVITQAQSGMSGFLFGADAMHLLRKCPCPVWLTHEQMARNYTNVMAAVDVNYYYTEDQNSVRRALNEDVLATAAEIALLENARLHIVHIYDAGSKHMIRDGLLRANQKRMDDAFAEIKAERKALLDELVNSLANSFDEQSLSYLQPESYLTEGFPAEEICSTADALKADVLVMGTVARVGIPGILMGNTAEEVLSNLDCAVLALKPKGFKSIIPMKK